MTTIVFLLTLAAMPEQRSCKTQFAPLVTGSHSGASNVPFWRKEEAGGWGGDGWLGWTWRDDTLRPLTLTVRDRAKTSAQDDEEVDVESSLTVSFAVRCLPQLRAGKIREAGIVNEHVDPKRPLNVSLGTRRYEVRVESAREDLYDAKVILSDGRRSQVLYSADGFADDPHFQICWAGDLDRDGKLDLVVNLHRKYSWHPYRLLLSSKASGNQIVGEAAVFETGD